MALTEKQQQVVDEWGSMICCNHEQIDPENELHWESMFIGFAVGRGLTIGDATDFSLYMLHAFKKEAQP